MTSVAASANAKGGDAAGTPTPATGVNYAGTWLQSSPTIYPVVGGGTSYITMRFQLTQSGTKVSGEARRFLTQVNAAGVVTYDNVDLGSPGKVSGSVNGAGALSIAVVKFAETKVNFSLVFTQPAVGTMTTTTANSYGLSSFTR